MCTLLGQIQPHERVESLHRHYGGDDCLLLVLKYWLARFCASRGFWCAGLSVFSRLNRQTGTTTRKWSCGLWKNSKIIDLGG